MLDAQHVLGDLTRFTVCDGNRFCLSLPQILNAMPRDYIGTLGKIRRHHSPLVHVRFLGGLLNFAFISDAGVNRTLFVRHSGALEKVPSQVQTFRFAAGESVATAHGDDWRVKRQEGNALFARKSIEAPCSGQIEVVREFARAHDQGPIDGNHVARSLAALSSSRGILGKAITLEQTKAQIAFSRAAGDRFNLESGHVLARPNWMLAPWRRDLQRRKRQAFSIVEQAIQELRKSPRPNDGLMAHYVNGDFVTSNDAEMQTILVGLLMGAQDSVAAAAGWALAFLAHHPKVQDQISEEILNAQEDAHSLQACGVLQSVLCEVLRLRPPAPANQPRRLTGSIKLAGYRLPKGTFVFNSVFNMHHDPDVFAQPSKFRPARFAQGSAQYGANFAPFGHGPRNCVAQAMARQQLGAILFGILKDHIIAPQSDAFPSITQTPFLTPSPFKITFHRRSQT